MSDKSTKNETPWRGRGFKKPYQGNNSYPFQEFVDANKSNSLNEAVAAGPGSAHVRS